LSVSLAFAEDSVLFPEYTKYKLITVTQQPMKGEGDYTKPKEGPAGKEIQKGIGDSFGLSTSLHQFWLKYCEGTVFNQNTYLRAVN